MQPLVSVIVPVYNVEACLARCLDSLSRQSLREIEIVLVDDASPDQCGAICEEYAANDSRFKVIHHPENRGLSVARNTGIANASGEYLMFVDSDDYVHEDFCKLPYECAVQYQADLVLFRYLNIDSKKDSFNSKIAKNYRISASSQSSLKSGYKTTKEAIDLLFKAVVKDYTWNKLYYKDLFLNISFPAGYYFEDNGTTHKAILKALKIYYLDKALYYYCVRSDSITALRTEKALHDWFEMSIQRYRNLVEWGGYSAKESLSILHHIAMGYCIKQKNDLANQDYMFCMDLLRSCKKIPEGFSLGRRFLFLLLKFSPSLFEQVCILWGKKYS